MGHGLRTRTACTDEDGSERRGKKDKPAEKMPVCCLSPFFTLSVLIPCDPCTQSVYEVRGSFCFLTPPARGGRGSHWPAPPRPAAPTRRRCGRGRCRRDRRQ